MLDKSNHCGIIFYLGDYMIEYLTFEISGQKFCIELLSIKEIITYREPNNIPASYSHVEGICMLRDQIVTVIEPRVLFNIFDDQKASHIIVLDFDDGYIGIAVTKLRGVIDVSDEQRTETGVLFSSSNSKGSEYIDYVINHDEGIFNSLNVTAFRPK